MLQRFFLTLLDMSIAAGYCVVFVIMIRLFMKKLPKSYSYALWAIVFVRLMLPVVPESAWSLMPGDGLPGVEQVLDVWQADEERVPDVLQPGEEQVLDVWQAGEERVLDVWQADVKQQDANGIVTEEQISEQNSHLPATGNSNDRVAGNVVDFGVHPLTVLAGMWLGMAVVLVAYGIGSSILLKHRLKDAVWVEEGILELANLPTAFVLGVRKPHIYLPADLPEAYRRYVIAHEKVHLKRGDLWIKYIAYFLTCVHWFNPFVWVAYVLMCRDMEMSCDECVLRALGMEEKKAYSTALLAIASGRKLQLGMPVAFSESDAKKRIKNVLNYRKPAFWMVLAAGVVILVLALGLLSDPRNERTEEDVATEGEVTEESASDISSESDVATESEVTEATESAAWEYKLITPEYLAEVEQWIEVKAHPSDMGFTRWFDEYGGGRLQNLIDYDGEKLLRLSEGVVFYQIEEEEWIGDSVRKMLDTSVELSIMELENYHSGSLWLVEYEDNVYFLMRFKNTYRLQRFEDMKTYKEKEVELEYVPIYAEDLEDKTILAEKLSAGVNAVFLCREYENVNELDLMGDSDIVFDFTRGFREDGMVDYYFDEETYCQAMARKMGQDMSEFLTGHNPEKSPYGKIYRHIKGDTAYSEFEVADVKWLDDSQAEIYYSSTYHNGVVVMKEHEGEMVFVSHRNIREGN